MSDLTRWILTDQVLETDDCSHRQIERDSTLQDIADAWRSRSGRGDVLIHEGSEMYALLDGLERGDE